MINKPNITFIGAFVLGAFVLVILGIITFGAEKYFSRQPTFVMYFEGSVKGLNVGAPVVFKGVKVGTVTDISLQFNPDTKSVQIEVLAEIDPHTITGTQGKMETQDFFKQLILQGLKAQLQYQNLLTGQLIIELDFHPEKPTKLVRSDLPYPQIPTTPSSIEELTKTIANLPLRELVDKLSSAISGIERVATSPELMQSIRSLNLALDDMRKVARNINSNLPPLASDLKGTLEDSRKAVQNFNKTAVSLQASLDQAAQATRTAMVQAEKTFRTMERASSKESPVMYQLSQTLEKISDASDSVRALTDYLNRHPEALLRGKGETGGK
jgi:paraquat-inducible protein B